MRERYYFSFLASRLEQILQTDVGLQGLETLMHGFIRKGDINRETLRKRKLRDGEEWLSPYEAKAFSEYAGYDLLSA